MTTTEAVAPEVRAPGRSERRILTPEGVPLVFQLAERGERAAAVMIDLVIMVIALIVFVLAITFILAELGVRDVALGLAILVSFLIRNFYFIFFELRWQGQTPGKRALGIRVIDRKGGYLHPGAVFSRNLLREVELFLPLTLVFGVDLTDSSGWVNFLTLGWAALCLLLPFFNKDRLRAGDLDLIVTAGRPLPTDDVVEVLLFEDRLSVVARADHPLIVKGMASIADLARYPWILPREGTPTRRSCDALLDRVGAQHEKGLLETGSQASVRGLLLESDRLTVLSRHQISPELEAGLLAAVDIDLPELQRTIVATLRRDWKPTQVQAALLGELKAITQAWSAADAKAQAASA